MALCDACALAALVVRLQGCGPPQPGEGPGGSVAEQRALRELERASQLVGGSLRAFWLLYAQLDPQG